MHSALEIVQNMMDRGDAHYQHNEWRSRKLLNRVREEIVSLDRENRVFREQFSPSRMREREETGKIPNFVPKFDSIVELERINECIWP